MHKTVSETPNANGNMPTKEVLWLGTLGTTEAYFRDFIETAREYSFAHDTGSTVVSIIIIISSSFLCSESNQIHFLCKLGLCSRWLSYHMGKGSQQEYSLVGERNPRWRFG